MSQRWSCREVGREGGGERGEYLYVEQGRDASARERCGSEIARGGVAQDYKDPPARFASEGAYPHSPAQPNPSLTKFCAFSRFPAPERPRSLLTPDRRSSQTHRTQNAHKTRTLLSAAVASDGGFAYASGARRFGSPSQPRLTDKRLGPRQCTLAMLHRDGTSNEALMRRAGLSLSAPTPTP
ncbi:hypothetical protein FKP32DRAFT_521606 [Trametes sanguinea]|nr:hypothetical protein FKP32DRAFT_521606 [Trametes sanguinea]